VESKVLFSEFGWQYGGLAIDEMVREIGLPVGHRYRFQHLFLTFEKVGNGDVEAVHLRSLKSGEIEAPVERIVERFKFRQFHFVVSLQRIAAGGDIERDFRQRGFEAHDGVGLFGGIGCRDAGQLQHPGDVGDVFFAGFDSFSVGAEIVVLLRQSDTALVGLPDHGV